MSEAEGRNASKLLLCILNLLLSDQKSGKTFLGET